MIGECELCGYITDVVEVTGGGAHQKTLSMCTICQAAPMARSVAFYPNNALAREHKEVIAHISHVGNIILDVIKSFEPKEL